MKYTALIGFTTLILTQICPSMILKEGESIEDADKAMKSAKHEGRNRHSPIELSMICLKKGSELRFWRVDRGVLIVQYAKVSNLIEAIDYDLSDTYSHAASVQFRFRVKTFDTESELMQVQTNSPTEAFQPSEQETNAKVERIESRLKEMEKEYEAEQSAPRQPATLPLRR